jgi:hypothetical protein
VRVELHDGEHAELRDTLTGGDRRRAKAAVEITIHGDESRKITAELEDRINYALLRHLIVSWSLPQTLPRDAASAEIADQILDDLPLEDVEALCLAIKPAYDRCMNGPKGRRAVRGRVLSTSSRDGREPASLTESPDT